MTTSDERRTRSAGDVPPFEFRRMTFLVEVTSLRAASVPQLLTGVTLAPDSSLFYHLHQPFFAEPDRLPDYPNDFATWASDMLGDAALAERVANLNLVRSPDLAAVRRELSVILADHLDRTADARSVRPGFEFLFCLPHVVEFPSGDVARTPAEFRKILAAAESDSIGYHLFVPRAATAANDFAAWFRGWGYDGLAQQLDLFDPYLNSLEDNRAYLLELIDVGLRQPGPGRAR